MNLMFWKKKAATSGDATPDEADRKPVASASSLQEVPDLAADVLQEAAHIKAARLKKRMLVFGMFGLLALIPIGLGVAVWKLFFSAKPPEVAAPVAANATPIPVNGPIIILPPGQGKRNLIKLPGIELSQPPSQKIPVDSAELDALRKKNEELEAQLHALKQENPPPAHTAPAYSAQRSAPSTARGDEVMLDGKDPKATAMTLKAAIEAMNAGTGGYTKKPPVKQQAKEPAKPATP